MRSRQENHRGSIGAMFHLRWRALHSETGHGRYRLVCIMNRKPRP